MLKTTICYSNEARASLMDAILKDITNLAEIPGNVLDYRASGEITRHLLLLLDLLGKEQLQTEKEKEKS